MAATKLIALALASVLWGSQPSHAQSIGRPGSLVDTVRCAAQPAQTYALYLPTAYVPTRPWPVVLVLDPAARGTEAAQVFRLAAERFGYVVAASHTSRNGPLGLALEAAAAIRADVSQRLAIDPRRVYLAGFSGGARAALAVAARQRLVAGVIGCGAGFPADLQFLPRPADSLAYLGFVGLLDPNYSELLTDQAHWEALGLPHTLRTFAGAHAWPPADVVRAGFAWLQTQAMRRKLLPVDALWLDSLATTAAARISAQETDHPYAAWQQATEAVDLLTGLREVGALRATAQRLASLPAVKAARKEAAAQLRLEEALLTRTGACYQQVMVAPLGPAGPELTCWRKLVKEVAALRAAPATHALGERVAGSLSLIPGEQGYHALRGGAYLEAETNFRLLLEAEPASAEAAYHLAAALAAQHKTDPAFAALARAAANGFRDAAAVERAPEFADVRADQRYPALLGQLRGH